MRANSSVAIHSNMPPIVPYAPPRLVQADLARAHGAGKASLDVILVAGLVPWLHRGFEDRRVRRQARGGCGGQARSRPAAPRPVPTLD